MDVSTLLTWKTEVLGMSHQMLRRNRPVNSGTAPMHNVHYPWLPDSMNLSWRLWFVLIRSPRICVLRTQPGSMSPPPLKRSVSNHP